MTDEDDDQFIEIIDHLVLMAENGSELDDGIKWIDEQARKKGVTFYEMSMKILRNHMAERRAKAWLRDKFNE